MLDHEVIGKFKEFQRKTGKYQDLVIEDVRFERISLSDENYFKFVKGKNHYIKKYNINNKGNFPLATGSVKNNSIAYYVKAINESDIVSETCISFNKDGDSTVFYRDYPFLMDRHHIAIIPTKLVDAKYLEKSLIEYFRVSKFGWGDNVASVDIVSSHLIPIPKKINEIYTSIKLQIIIVEFLKYGFNWLDGIQSNIDKQNDVYKRLRKSLIPSTFKKDYIKIKFAKYAKKYNIDFNITDVEFEINDFDNFFETLTPPRKIKNKATKKVAKFPVVSQSDGLINGYTDEVEGIIEASDNPIVLFGDHSTIVKYIDFNFFAGADGTKILKPLENILPLFAYYQTTDKVKQMGYQRHFQYLKEKKFLIPKSLKEYTSFEIQKIIANFINEVDDEIQESFDKIDKGYEAVKRYKRAYLARTFSLVDWSKE